MSKTKKDRDTRNIFIDNSFDNQNFIWAFSKRINILKESQYNFRNISYFCKKIKPKLDGFCTMTWSELKNAKSFHSVQLADAGISKDLLKIINELWTDKPDDAPDELFQLRLDSTHRIFGIREGWVFLVLLNDPYHQLYPSHKKHT